MKQIFTLLAAVFAAATVSAQSDLRDWGKEQKEREIEVVQPQENPFHFTMEVDENSKYIYQGSFDVPEGMSDEQAYSNLLYGVASSCRAGQHHPVKFRRSDSRMMIDLYFRSQYKTFAGTNFKYTTVFEVKDGKVNFLIYDLMRIRLRGALSQKIVSTPIEKVFENIPPLDDSHKLVIEELTTVINNGLFKFYQRMHNDIPIPTFWSAIEQGDIEVGMTYEECVISLGVPEDVNSMVSARSLTQFLHFHQYTIMFEDGIVSSYSIR